MLFRSTALLALGASAVLASPVQRLNKRQETTTSAPASDAEPTSTAAEESISGSAAQSSAVTSVEVTASGTEASSAVSSVESAISSVAESTGSEPAPEATTTSAEEGSPELAFGCPDGYSLTYAIGISTYPEVELSEASEVLSNWTGAVPPPIEVTESEGEGEGAMRTWTLGNLTVMETLFNQTESEDGTLMQMWNLSEPLMASESVMVTNATSDLTLYSNTTTNETSVQLFVNFCVNDQPAGLTLYSEIVTAYLTGLNSLFSGENATETGAGEMTSMAESTMMSATESASSVASDATASPSSVASEATEGASSVISEATAGATDVVSSAIEGATSVAGDVTSLIPTSVA